MDCPHRPLRHPLLWVTLVFFTLSAPMAVRADDDQPPPQRKLSEQELLRKRIAESLSGVRDSRAPKSETLKGPELSDREKVIHVLNRLSFGPRPGEIDEVLKNGGWEAWVKQQMQPEHVDDATCDRVIAQKFPWTKWSIKQFGDKYGGYDNRGKIKEMREALPEEVLVRAVMSNRQLKEVMCDFWRNHFCVDLGEDEKTRGFTDADYDQNVIQKYCFGKFRDMLVASATHPAMLEYLDNKLSKINNWNENYAREVMELHTIGADRGYGNQDVQELSKALTGWTYNKEFQFVFDAKEHQPGTQHWLGMTLPAGFSGGVTALNVLAAHPNTGQFISEKLCRYLVNDNPPPTLVKHVANVFRESQGDLPKVYMAIITSKEFMDRANYKAKFKTPFWFTVSVLRATNAKIDKGEDVTYRIRKMGEPIYDCPDPTGYRDQAESWMDAGVLTTRWQVCWDLIKGSLDGVTVPDSFLARYRADKPEESEQKMIEDLLGGDAGDRELAALKDAANSHDLQRMLSIVLGSPSFQQR